ncbi:hypothetical protein [Micromonospora thermarum]|uniref:Uncharacterized protein n=1 Tax=Micromonospora thermarum TaxID=2720024 RepID=A0ABX0Z4J8_9ACTN|nr:hypothetical protein [Micromonospora thermarum]NJP32717.1 hypothetical protein [Micromonospora thermarum]
MSYRRKDTGPRVALWMLVALGDVVLVLASAGLPLLVALLTVVTVTVAGVVVWRLSRRSALTRTDAVTVPVAARRRA